MSNRKLQRSDESHSADRQRLLERGHLVLHAISTEAHAARVEAKKAELEVALAEAQGGNLAQLQNWLEAYQASSSSTPDSIATSPFPSAATSQSTGPVIFSGAVTCLEPDATPASHATPLIETPAADSIQSWEQLLPHARQRLASRTESHEVQSISAASIEASPIEDVANETPLDDEDTPYAEPLLEDFERRSNEPLEFEVLPELNLLAGTQRELDKPYSLSGKRGLLVSAIFHTAILLSLMAISMRLPEQAASLGFESSSYEGTSESIEVMQAIDVVAPELTPEMPAESSAPSSSTLPSATALSSSVVSSSSVAASSSLSNISASASQATAMTGAGKPNLSKVNASFFGAAAGGNSFCYVIDGSESMRGGPWESAKRELLRSLSTLKENQRFYVIFFNKQVHAIPRIGETEPSSTALYATPENLKHATEWIEALRIAPGAPPDNALEMAIELELDAIYFLADGATKRDVCEFLRTKNRTADFISGEQIRVPVHTIAFYSPEVGRKLMQRIANENKGQSIYVPDPRKK